MTADRPQQLPLTAPQRAIWTAQQFEVTGYGYNVAECVEIHGSLDPGLFTRVVHAVETEAQSLHIRIVADAEDVRQIPCTPGPGLCTFLDLVDRHDARALAEEVMRTEVETPLELSQRSALRNLLFRIDADVFLWFHGYHHLVADGATGGLLWERISETYSALAADRPVPPGRARPLARIVEEDLAYRASEDFALDRAYWTALLAQPPAPVDLVPVADVFPVGRALRHSAELSPRVLEALGAAARRASTSWPVAVLAASAAHLHHLSGQDELILGLPVTGRGTPAARNTPGMFSNVLPLRLRVPARATTDELLRQTSRAVREMRAHQRYRGEDLVRDLALRHGSDRLWGTEVNIMSFGYQGGTAGDAAPGVVRALNVGPVDRPVINVFDRRNGLPVVVQFEADSARCDEKELKVGLEHFMEFLERFAGGGAV